MSQTKAQLVSGLSINASAPATSLNIDSSGRVLVGTSTARSNFYNTGAYTPTFQLESTAGSSGGTMAALIGSSADAFGAYFIFAHQRSGTIGGNTIVNNSDTLGAISFQGSDGSEFVPGATIEAVVDGTPGANDMPGRLVFSTTADGASSPTEQMRLDSSGNLKFNSGYGSVATAYGCRAWVNFNGTGTVAIRASGNVSSITDNGVADYTVNFTTAMADTNYSICGAAGLNTTSLKVVCQPFNLSPPATSSVRIQVPNADGVMVSDSPYISVAIFR
jgi:hypothetical protein